MNECSPVPWVSIPPSILYLCKSQIRVKMEHCYHIWPAAAQYSLSTPDRVEKRLHVLVGDKLFSTLQPPCHRWDVTSLSLLYRYFHGECSDELQSLILPVQTFTAKSRHATPILANHPHPLHELNEVISLDSLVQTFTAKTHYARPIVAIHPHHLYISLMS